MCIKSLRNTVRRMVTDESGAATAEFAILLPVFLAIFFGLVWMALYLLTISNVQQLALEAARQALQYSGGAFDRAQLCATIQQELLPELAESFVLIRLDSLGALQCSAGSQPGWSMINVSYDTSHMGFNSVFSILNGGSDQIVGRAIVMGG